MEKSWPFLLLLHFHCYLLSYSLAKTATNLQTDELSLLALKSRITLNSSRLNWTSKTSVCNWTGVTCGRRHRRVVALDISEMGLNGSIPTEFGNLTFLAYLYMGGNSFHGDLPAELGGLRRLRVLDLSDNDFSGEIPKSLVGNATLLEDIYFTDNSFSVAEMVKLSIRTCTWLFAAALIAAIAPPCAGAIICPTVYDRLKPCYDYVTGKSQLNFGGCCGGVKRLYNEARTTKDKQTVCTCLKSIVGSHSRIDQTKAADLPRRCGINLPYKISINIDCKRVK